MLYHCCILSLLHDDDRMSIIDQKTRARRVFRARYRQAEPAVQLELDREDSQIVSAEMLAAEIPMLVPQLTATFFGSQYPRVGEEREREREKERERERERGRERERSLPRENRARRGSFRGDVRPARNVVNHGGVRYRVSSPAPRPRA